MKKNCEICAIDKKNFISCPTCSFESCVDCISENAKVNNQGIQCISCKKNWPTVFVLKSFPSRITSNKTLKEKHKLYLFESEKAKIPETMELVSLINEKDKLVMEHRQIAFKLKELKEKLYGTTNRISVISHNLRNDLINEASGSSSNIKKEKKPILVSRCPKEDCKGFITADKYTCGLCDIKICLACYKILEDDHSCDLNDVASISLLKKDTKPCPNCSCPCKKVEGCNNVWCSNKDCFTAWNWSTGEKTNGPTDARDYFDYMRRNNMPIPRYENLNNCRNQLGKFQDTIIRYERSEILNFDQVDTFAEIYQKILEYNSNIQPHNDVFDLRIKYMQNKISEEVWKKSIVMKEKQYVYMMEIYNMKRSFNLVGEDLLIRYVMAERYDKKLLNEILDFAQLYYDEFNKLSKAFGSKRQNPFVDTKGIRV